MRQEEFAITYTLTDVWNGGKIGLINLHRFTILADGVVFLKYE
ncbi:MAG: hypothetical protein ACYTBX_01605 [Planctomycetota bacterium]